MPKVLLEWPPLNEFAERPLTVDAWGPGILQHAAVSKDKIRGVIAESTKRQAQRNKIQEEALHKLHFLAGCSLLSLCELWFHCEIPPRQWEVRVCFQWRREGSSQRWAERLTRKSSLWDLSADIRPFEDERVSQYPDAGILNELIRLGVNMTQARTLPVHLFATLRDAFNHRTRLCFSANWAHTLHPIGKLKSNNASGLPASKNNLKRKLEQNSINIYAHANWVNRRANYSIKTNNRYTQHLSPLKISTLHIICHYM